MGLPGLSAVMAGIGFNPSTPAVAATNTDNAGNTSSTAINLPSGITVGDLLVLIVQIGRANVTPTISTPSGWTLLEQFVGNGNLRKVAVFHKTASGSEGSTVTVSADNTAEWSAVTYRITGWTSGLLALAASPVTGTGAAADPPAVSATWGKGVLAIAIASHLTYGSAATVPSGYSGGLSDGISTGTANRINTAHRLVSDADDEDPGAFTLAGSYNYVTNTLLVG